MKTDSADSIPASDELAEKTQQLAALERQKAEKERELSDLRTLERKQTDCDRGRSEMLDSLRKSLVILEHEETHARAQLERMGSTRLMFHELLDKLEGIDQQSWNPSNLNAELTRALTQIENARIEFQRARAALPILDDQTRTHLLHEHSNKILPPLRFRDWAKIGFAITLPLLVLGAVLLLILLVWSLKYKPVVGQP